MARRLAEDAMRINHTHRYTAAEINGTKRTGTIRLRSTWPSFFLMHSSH